MSNIFEYAARNRLRFATGRGQLTVEDLWDMPLQNNPNNFSLDDLAKGLFLELKKRETPSFVNKPQQGTEQTRLEISLEIVKHVIAVRLAEAEAKQSRASTLDTIAQLNMLIQRKQAEKLESLSEDELKARLEALHASIEVPNSKSAESRASATVQ